MSTSLKIAGVILAGGKSSRMGSPKADLIYQGISLIDRMACLFSSIELPVWISGKDDGPFSIPDKTRYLGPMSGIMASIERLDKQGYQAAIFVPVDMPLLTSENLRALINGSQQADAICFHHYPLPLLVYFTEQVKNTLFSIENKIEEGISIKYFLKLLSLVELEITNPLHFTNVNTPSDWINSVKFL